MTTNGQYHLGLGDQDDVANEVKYTNLAFALFTWGYLLIILGLVLFVLLGVVLLILILIHR